MSMDNQKFRNKVKLFMILHNYEVDAVLEKCKKCIGNRNIKINCSSKNGYHIKTKGVFSVGQKKYYDVNLCFRFLEKK